MGRKKKVNLFRYLEKYVGTYRVKTDAVDMDTGIVISNDPTADDLYIPTSKKFVKIKHTYDEEYPVCVFIDDDHTGTSNNIKSSLKEKKIPFFSEDVNYIYFKEDYIHDVCKMLGVRKSGAKIKPFSHKNNTKKEKYNIPSSDLEQYKSVIDSITVGMERGDKMRFVGQINKSFMSKYKLTNDLNLGTKEYLHKNGLWGKYIKYLKREGVK